MTREELFRAVGEVREDQIEAAEIVKKQIHPWRRFGALAACLALIVTVTAAAVPEIRGQLQWKAIVRSFQPAVKTGEDADRDKGEGGKLGEHPAPGGKGDEQQDDENDDEDLKDRGVLLF